MKSLKIKLTKEEVRVKLFREKFNWEETKLEFTFFLKKQFEKIKTYIDQFVEERKFHKLQKDKGERMKKIIGISLLLMLINLEKGFGQEFPLTRYYTYGKTPFEIVCLGVPEFERKDSQIFFQKIFEFESESKILQGIALKYIGEFYKSAKAVIDVNDSENGLIIVKGILIRPYLRYYRGAKMMEMNLETSHNLTFEFKDNRIRVTINNFSVTINNSSPTSLDELIEAYQSKDAIYGSEEDFRFKANLGIPLNLVYNDFTSFMNGFDSYFEMQLKDDW